MEVITLDVSTRETGKKASKAVRRSQNVPCVLYANGVEPMHFQVSELALKPLIYTADTHTVQVKLGKDSWSCILRDMDFHPTNDRPIHADFQVLLEGETIRLTIPILFVGTSVGERKGGYSDHVMTELEIECLPKNIPSHIEVDVTELDYGDSLQVSDLSVEGITILDQPERSLVIVSAAREEIEEDEEVVEESEAEGDVEED